MWCVSVRPTPSHVLPASIDLWTPSPASELREVNASPVPTHTMSGFDGAVATAPIETLACPSNTGANVVPLFVVFQSPPVQKPTYQVYRWSLPSGTATIDTRAPIRTGPTLRYAMPFSVCSLRVP